VNGFEVDTEMKSEGISDDGTLIVEIKDTASIYAPLSPNLDDWIVLQNPQGIKKIKPKDISRDGKSVIGESETNENQKRIFTWTPDSGFFFHEHTSFSLPENVTVFESKAEAISRDGKYITGAVKMSLEGSEAERPFLLISDPIKGQDKPQLLPALSNSTIIEEDEFFIADLFLKKMKGNSVNNNGIIIGEVEAVDGNNFKFFFIYWPDEQKFDFLLPEDLISFPPCSTGSCELKGKTINENNEVIIEMNGPIEESAVVWQARKPTDPEYLNGFTYIPSPTTQRLKLHAMNNRGFAIGHTYTDDEVARVAVIVHYDREVGGQVKYLTDLVDLDRTVKVLECKGISESGMIACEGVSSTGDLAAFHVVPIYNGDVDLDLEVTENDLEAMSRIIKSGRKVAGLRDLPLTDAEFLQLYDLSGDGEADNDDIAALGEFLGVSYEKYLIQEEKIGDNHGSNVEDKATPTEGLEGAGKALIAIGLAVAIGMAIVVVGMTRRRRNQKDTKYIDPAPVKTTKEAETA